MSIDDILEKWQNNATLMKHLPDKREIYKLPKQFLVNICYKLIGERFETWIRAKIDERNQKIADKQNIMISVDPEMAGTADGKIVQKIVQEELGS